MVKVPLTLSAVSPLAFAVLATLAFAGTGCSKNEKPEERGSAPPPVVESAKPGACASGGGTVDDPVQGEFFVRTAGGYCLEPQGDTKTYGDRGKLTMDQVCTTAVDGECEVYKSYGLKRAVIVRYVDGGGGGGSVEVVLTTFGDPGGAYGMFTKRVIADADPADARAPKPITAGGAGALGNGRGYVWKGPYLAELTYLNEQESPEQITKSSAPVLTAIAEGLGGKLPGSADKPAAAQALPTANLVPNGIQYFPKEVLGIARLGAGAVGYYKDGTKRYRIVSLVRDDADVAKDAMKLLRQRPGTLPVAQLADEALHLTLQDAPDRPKSEYVVARKGTIIFGVGDEDLVVKPGEPAEKQGELRLSKDEKIARLRTWILAAAGVPAAPAADAGKR
ncbi:hypothetical protein LVJ94_39330 [Pendulispora rubella]|uniref:Lipoprotein n=1 Tax=Pendulispora rubella TaxID=2741070 RepID=A0ABZ2KW83_9BACT